MIPPYSLETLLVQSGSIHTPFGETGEAMFLNSAYTFESAEAAERRFALKDGYTYSRYSNPSIDMLEQRLVAIEAGAERAIVTASGMSAVFAALMSGLKAGDHVVANKVLFSSCYYIITQLLPQYGVSYTLVDSEDEAAWQAAFTDKTTYVFIESPANPTMQLVDIAAVASLCKAHSARLVVDNVFATPLYQHPLELGADIVIYSTTKHMDGQGRTLGGAILGKAELIDEVVQPFIRHTGPHMSPFTCWVVFKALETLSLRMDRHSDNAMAVASAMEQHGAIKRAVYPHLESHPQYSLAKAQMKRGGGVFVVELADKQAAFRFMNALRIGRISNNIGDAKTLITHPASTTHASIAAEQRAEIGIGDGLVRISVGLEDKTDLVADFNAALNEV